MSCHKAVAPARQDVENPPCNATHQCLKIPEIARTLHSAAEKQGAPWMASAYWQVLSQRPRLAAASRLAPVHGGDRQHGRGPLHSRSLTRGPHQQAGHTTAITPVTKSLVSPLAQWGHPHASPLYAPPSSYPNWQTVIYAPTPHPPASHNLCRWRTCGLGNMNTVADYGYAPAIRTSYLDQPWFWPSGGDGQCGPSGVCDGQAITEQSPPAAVWDTPSLLWNRTSFPDENLR